MTTQPPEATATYEAAKEATAKMLHELFGMDRTWFDLSDKRKDARRAQAEKILTAAGYEDPQAAKAVGYAHAATRASAALKLVSPDHITPVGEHQVTRALEDNPYLREAGESL